MTNSQIFPMNLIRLLSILLTTVPLQHAFG